MMKLLNNYKIIYSAHRNGEFHAYATKKLPLAEDVALTYINEERHELSYEEIDEIKLVYSKGNSLYYSFTGFPAEDDHKLFIYCENELVFGEEGAPEPVEKYTVSVGTIEHALIEGAGRYAEGANVRLLISPVNGYQWGELNAPKVNGELLTKEGNKFVYEFIMGNEAVEVEFTDVVIEEIPAPEKHEVSINAIEHVVIEGEGEFFEGENVRIVLSLEEGYQWGAGNAPKVGQQLLVADGNSFVYEFIMGNEAIAIEIEDILVEEIPAPVVPKVYYFAGEERPVEINVDEFEAEDFNEAAEYIEHEYVINADSYYAVAVPASKPIQHAYQNGLESFDVLDMFEEIQANVGNEAYLLYVTNDIQVAGDENDMFKFVF